MSSSAKQVQEAIRSAAKPEHAEIAQRFFKSGPGEYGEGDVFVGVKIPPLRKTALSFRDLPLQETTRLLHSKIHEDRLAALFILVDQFKRGDEDARKRIFDLYLKNTKYINNWDLIDLSSYKIVGPFLEDKSTRILDTLARSKSLWERRIAMLATFHFIRLNRFTDTLRLARILLRDEHDLIHKAVGWMLREVGNRDMDTEEAFLKKHYTKMPRTMLRYAIEKFPEKKRQGYLKGTIRET